MITMRRFVRIAAAVSPFAVCLWIAEPAHAQFGREYLRYSVYGSGPYGYGSKGYRKAVTPESPAFENTRVLETDYGYDPPRTYEGTLYTERIPEHPLPRARHIPWYDPRMGPDYHYFGGGIYGPYGPFDYGINPPRDIFRSVGQAR